MALDFDYLLNKVGVMGLYQSLVLAVTCYFGIACGLSGLASVFISYSPDYRCTMCPFDNSTQYPNISQTTITNLTTPVDKNGDPVDACVKYSYDTSECTELNDFSCVDFSAPTKPCDDYYFDRDLFTETSKTQFQLICDRNVLDTVATAMYMLGLLFGALIFGYLSDKIGRRYSGIIGSYGVLLAMTGVGLSNSLPLFIMMRFLNGLFSMGTTVAVFSHILEIVGNDWRTFMGMVYSVSFALGYMLWSAIAYLYRDWHQMQLAAVVISCPLAIFILFVPESARWLLANDRNDQGKKVIKMMAKLNNAELHKDMWTEAELPEKKNECMKKYSTLDLLRYPQMRILTIKVAFNWFVNTMVYYGVSLNAGSLAGDIFLNNIYAGVLEIASYIMCLFTMDRVGRRLLLTILLTGAGVVLLISTIFDEISDGDQGLVTAGVVFAIIGKAMVSGSFAVIYNFTGELYPTVVRSNGVGFGAMTARIGGILAPFIISIQDYVSWLPNTIFGVIAVTGGLLSLTIRDTTGRPMMETIEEAELFYAGKEPKKEAFSNLEGCENKSADFTSDGITRL